MRAVIFANGDLHQPIPEEAWLREGDVVIAADGGSVHCRQLGIVPDIVIGDLDSLTEKQVQLLEAMDVKLIRYPAHKDFTDLELAVQYAIQEGILDIVILGALGQRWDQTLANLLLPAAAPFSQARIRLLDGQQEISLIQAGQTLEFHGQPGDTFSLIPLLGNAEGITTQGLEYPLGGETLYFGATRGLSNVLLEQTVQVYLNQGTLLSVLIHQTIEEKVNE